jgi:hypothetical protein
MCESEGVPVHCYVHVFVWVQVWHHAHTCVCTCMSNSVNLYTCVCVCVCVCRECCCWGAAAKCSGTPPTYRKGEAVYVCVHAYMYMYVCRGVCAAVFCSRALMIILLICLPPMAQAQTETFWSHTPTAPKMLLELLIPLICLLSNGSSSD